MRLRPAGLGSTSLTSTTLSSIERLAANNSLGTTFTVDQDNLAASGSITGGAGVDKLVSADTELDLTSATLSSIEVLQAGGSDDTTFIVNQADLAAGGSITGNAGDDTVLTHDTQLDLSSTTLTSIEILKTDNGAGTGFIVNQADLAWGGSIQGSDGSDTIVAAGSALDLTGSVLTSVEIIGSRFANGTTFTVDQADLVAGGSVVGSTGTDTLIIQGTSADLTSTSLTSIEVLKSTADSSDFIVNNADLAAGGGSLTSIVGSTGTNTLAAADAALDLSDTTLTNVQVLQAASTSDTTFTVDQNDLATAGSVVGNAGNDTIAAGGSSLDLSSTTLSSIENITISASGGSLLAVTSDQLASLNVTGGPSSADTLILAGTDFDLTSTTLNNFEALKAGSPAGTTFTLDYADITALGAGGSITGSTGVDTLIVAETNFDLTSTTLSRVEILQAGTSDTTFTVNQDDLASGGSVVGSDGTDVLKTVDTQLNLTSTTLTSIETIKTGTSAATTFTVDQTDLKFGGMVVGSTGNDTLTINGNSLNLTNTTLSSLEILKAGTGDATSFTVDQGDLAAGGSVVGNAGTDSLRIGGTTLDLNGTTLSSIEILQSTSTFITTFSVGRTIWRSAARSTAAAASSGFMGAAPVSIFPAPP